MDPLLPLTSAAITANRFRAIPFSTRLRTGDTTDALVNAKPSVPS
jgi:hypothetical protein